LKKVEILLSSYNGADTIERQIESIINQKGVNIHITIRDDGSKDATCSVIKKMIEKYGEAITLVYGENVGWKKSFLDLIGLAIPADYYGFADQDDLWFDEKVKSSIERLEKDDFSGIKLVQVNSICTDEYLNICEEQQNRYGVPRNRKAVIAQEYFQGCGMMWNDSAMEVLKKYSPTGDLAHDFWVGNVCFYLGKIYCCDEPLFYHIRYGNNSSSDGNVQKGRMKRVLKIRNNNTIYMNPAEDLIRGYRDDLSYEDCKFLTDICEAKKNFFKRIKYVFSKEFRRESFTSTILFKLIFLLGKY